MKRYYYFIEFFSEGECRNEIAGRRHEANGRIFKNIDGITAYLFAAGNDPVFTGKLRMRRRNVGLKSKVLGW